MNAVVRQAAARVLCVGFESNEVDRSLRRWIDLGVGGVVLFSHNVGSPRETAGLLGKIGGLAGRPILRMVDQEGGRVARLREGFTVPPAMRQVGALGDTKAAWTVGRVLGRELASVGFNMNLAPVLDISTHPDSTVIDDRSLGSDARRVAELAGPLIEGIESAGVAACGKHFPGHGDTPEDSHLKLPRLAVPREVLDARELLPFRAAITAKVAAIMPGHLVVEALDKEQPATLSSAVLSGLLRREMGFGGLIVSDDLEMKAIVDHYPMEQAAVAAMRAGVDLLVIGHRHDRAEAAFDGLLAGVASGELRVDRLIEAASRVDALAARGNRAAEGDGWRSVVGCDEHRRAIDAILARLPEGDGAAKSRPDPTVTWHRDAGANRLTPQQR
jgi:beta-N-acetylhexosaminidase